MGKKRVLLVHGVNPDRTWPARVRRILEPHFECHTIDYNEYDGLMGPIRAVLPVTALVLFLVAIVATPVLWTGWGGRAAGLAFVSGCAVLLVGLLIGWLMRRRVLRIRYRSQLDGLGIFSEPPHVIAHSLGTWLTSHAMLKIHTALFDRVIFAGSIVPRRFAWGRLLKSIKPDAFTHLRNEVGRTDWVVLFAGLLPIPITEMGYGGLWGFVPCDLVHNQDTVRGRCQTCDNGAKARIHNVRLDAYRHSDAFLGFLHIAELWLPDLWGYSPREVADFFRLCQAMVRLEDEARAAGLDAGAARLLTGLGTGERMLRDRDWEWTDSMTLEQFLTSRLEAIANHAGIDPQGVQPEISAAVTRTVHQLYHIVNDAVKACDPNRPIPSNALALNPAIAINCAISAAIRGTPWALP